MNFDLQSCRFHFVARDTMHFPSGQTGNILRGAFGILFRKIACGEDCPGHAGRNIRECHRRTNCPYARIFEAAAADAGPSGLSDWPRPFVLRASSLDGRTLKPGDEFCFGLNLFDTRNPALPHFTQAFAQWAELLSVEQSPLSVDLEAPPAPVSRIRVEFQTPTELKNAAAVGNGDFALLLARIRDRVSTLRSLYGDGPLEIDFRALGERARYVKTVRCELRHIAVERRSSRTRQRHGIGGFVGFAEYEGDLTEFLPYLQAAHFTGVGRHCTWGNGQIQAETLNSES